MFNPTDSNKDFGSYVDLRKRVFQRIQSGGLNERILEMMRMAFEDAVKSEGVVLSRPEKRRLQAQVLKQILEEMVQGIEGGSKSGSG